MNLEEIVTSLKTHKNELLIAGVVIATAVADAYSTIHGVETKGLNREDNWLVRDLIHQFGPVTGVGLTKALFLPLAPFGDWLSKKVLKINHLISYYLIAGQSYGAISWHI